MSLPAGCHPACSACAHRELSQAESEAQKADFLRHRLAPWAGQLAPLQGALPARRWGYRDRISLSCRWQEGQWRFGLWRRDDFVPIPSCPIHTVRVNATLALLSAHLPAPLHAHFPSGENFSLAYVVISAAHCVLVFKQATPPPTQWFSDELMGRLAALGMRALSLHCFPSAGRRLFTKRGWQLLWGEERSEDEQGMWYGPGAFTQLLPELHRASIDEAAAFLQPGDRDRVVDLYCGRGLTLRRWLDSGAEAVGVELGGEALACAARNAPAAERLRGSCAARLPQLAAWWAGTPPLHRLAYLNPPRTGLETEVVEWLGRTAVPQRIAYLSCSAGTLARDLERLEQHGYRVERLTPYDFFPQTYHVETLALLSRSA